MGRHLCFSRHCGFVISATFCPDTSDSKVSSFAFIHFPVLLKPVNFAFIAFTVGQMLIVCFEFCKKEVCALRADLSLTV